MTPERWERIQGVFAAALDRAPSSRAAFLQEISQSDAELAKEVESLLESHEKASTGFPKSPAVGGADLPREALAAKTRLGPYEILGRLGSGGMGEVYRARDRKLDRDVAIKVLPAHLMSSAAALSRLEREAKAVAALSHPNILSIFDFGTHDGTAYAVTELLEGETLRSKLDGGAIPPRLAVDYSIQIAKGLAAAHERGVIHRDLKPENIFVSKDGHLKILDFGLAKREERVAPGEETSAPTASGETQPGTIMGTVGYMSPEQVRAIPADHRSDIFSFGTILYEMLSGKRAFKKDTAGDTMAAILRDEPSPLAQEVPESLGRIVDHCLAKDRDNRFQSARDVVFALSEPSSVPAISAPSFPVPSPLAPSRRRVRVVAAAAGAALLIALGILLWRARSSNRLPAVQPAPATTRRIVVLPFENQGDAQDAYFAAGMTEEIINRLANLHGVAVISRATAMGYDRKGKTTKQIGTDLGVDYVLGGSIRWDRQAGGQSKIRITPELVRVGDDTHLWGERYDRVLADIFAIQSDVAENVSRALNIQLLPREKSAIDAASTSDMEAYDLYLRGLAAANRSRLPKDQEEALTLFEAAVKRDPRFAPALLQLAKAHLYMVVQHVDRTPERVEKARQAVEQLGAVGPDLPETHMARGYLAYRGLEPDFPRAQEEFQKVLSLQPNSFEALFGMMALLRRMGRFEEAAATSARLIEVDPRNPTALFQHGIDNVLAGQYAEAERSYALAVSFNPRDGATWGRRAWNQIQWRGDAARAKAMLLEASQVAGLDDDRSFAALAAFRVALILGDYRGALQQLDSNPRETLESQFVYYPKALLRAQAHALLGDREQARRDFAAARTDLEKRALEHPDDARYPSALGITLAGLGRRDEAIAAAKTSVELTPESKDVWWWLARVEDLALVHTMLGETDAALDQIELLVSRGGEMTTQVLSLDPQWKPLEASSRFQALLSKYGGKK